MKVTSKKEKNSRIILTVTLDTHEFTKYESQAVKKLAGEIKVDGFRKGNIPESVVRQKAGEATIKQNAMDLALSQTYVKALEQENVNPLSQPEVEIKGIEPFSYTAAVDVYPEVVLALKEGELKKVKLLPAKVTKKEVKEQIDLLRENLAEKKSVKRAAKKGDTAVIDFNGKDKQGVEQPGMKSEGHPLELGSNQFIPGFEEHIDGLKKGEEKTFEVVFPKDYHAKEYAGKPFDFTVVLQDVMEKTLPKVDAEFVEKLTGEKKSVEDLEKEISDLLVQQKEKENYSKAQQEVFELIGKNTKAEIPALFLTAEVDGIVDNIKMQGLQGGLPWEKHLENMKMTEEELRKDVEKDAEIAILSQLGLQELIKQENIQVTDAEIQEEIDAEIANAPEKDRAKVAHSFEPHHDGRAKVENRLRIRTLFSTLLK